MILFCSSFVCLFGLCLFCFGFFLACCVVYPFCVFVVVVACVSGLCLYVFVRDCYVLACLLFCRFRVCVLFRYVYIHVLCVLVPPCLFLSCCIRVFILGV